MRLLFTPPEPTERVHHGDRIRLARPRLVRGAHARPHRRPPLPVGPRDRHAALRRPRAAVDHAARLGRAQGRLAEVVPRDARPRRAARRREARAARARPPVRRRARAGSRRSRSTTTSAWRCCATRRSRSARRPCADLSHEVFPKRHWGVMAESETFAHLEHLRARRRWPSAGTKAACSSTASPQRADRRGRALTARRRRRSPTESTDLLAAPDPQRVRERRHARVGLRDRAAPTCSRSTSATPASTSSATSRSPAARTSSRASRAATRTRRRCC